MILTYAKYIEVISALDEYCNYTLKHNELQDAIFNHYIGIKGSFGAENVNGDKQLFTRVNFQNDRRNKNQRKLFRNFMNVPLRNKHKNKQTHKIK